LAHESRMLAYRVIVEEKKPEKPWKFRCTICGETKEALDGECGCDGSKKKPEKQTLLTWMLKEKVVSEEESYLVESISEYLEQKDK